MNKIISLSTTRTESNWSLQSEHVSSNMEAHQIRMKQLLLVDNYELIKMKGGILLERQRTLHLSCNNKIYTLHSHIIRKNKKVIQISNSSSHASMAAVPECMMIEAGPAPETTTPATAKVNCRAA